MENYRRILNVLRSAPRHPDVTPIEPQGHEALSFFPGQRGFVGASFPIGGVMLVANNYDNLQGWRKYKADLSAVDKSKSFKKLTEVILPAAQVPIEECWLTNYALGVMDKPTSQYKFPRDVRDHLTLAEKIEEFVSIMQPRLIVAMGGDAQSYLRVRRGEVVDLFGTKAIAIWHPGRFHKSDADLEAEGARIREALEIRVAMRPRTPASQACSLPGSSPQV